jgi:hypothetical protein
MEDTSYLGLLELILVFGFVLGLGLLELLGLRLDRARKIRPHDSTEGARHPER